MTDIDLNAIRERAEAATPGPWEWQNPWTPFPSTFEARRLEGGQAEKSWCRPSVLDGLLLENLDGYPGAVIESNPADAAHIAGMDPQTVLALLDRLAAAEAAVERVRKLADHWKTWSGEGIVSPVLSGWAATRARELRGALGGGA